MRISFDIDDTLIFYDKEKRRQCRHKLLNGERLRDGTVELFRSLQKEHEIWLYTSSLRSERVLKLCFLIKRIKIQRVINNAEHLLIIKERNITKPCTKLPTYYNIDLHIDDSPGVAMEGEEFNYNVLIISPNDNNWTDKIYNHINKL
jgi:hypothetical protein